MNEKFMKVMKIVVPTLTVILIASQLFGAPATSQQETLDLIQKNEQIEIEIAVPKDEEQGELKSLDWIILSELDTYQETLRGPVEDAFYIKVDPTTCEKTGYFYRDSKGNTVKDNSLKNILTSNPLVAQMLDNDKTLEALSNAALDTYADLEADDTYTNAMLALNGYFNLLPDAEPAYANPNSTLTRAEFMTMVFRANNTVDKTLTVNKDFESLVGKSEYNLYAQGLADKTYLGITDKSLNEKTYNGTISRAEAIYYFVSANFPKQFAEFDASEVTLSDAIDGGDIATEQGFADKNYSKSYELVWAINNPDEGLPTDLYKALAFAQYNGLIDKETRWDEGLTKAEAVELMINTYNIMGQGNNEERAEATKPDAGSGEVNNDTGITKDNSYYYDEYGRFDCGWTEDFGYEEDIVDGVLGFELCYNADGTTYLKYNKDGSEYHLLDTLPNGRLYTGKTAADAEAIKQYFRNNI